jgi:hypothetical protein
MVNGSASDLFRKRFRCFFIDVSLSTLLLFLIRLSLNSENDLVKIEAVEWLMFDPDQRLEGMRQANAIVRDFVGRWKEMRAGVRWPATCGSSTLLSPPLIFAPVYFCQAPVSMKLRKRSL